MFVCVCVYVPLSSTQVASHINLAGMNHNGKVPNGIPQSTSSNGLAFQGAYGGLKGTPYLSKLESIASSAVRAADKVCMPLT